jgi:hypothetical protein
MQKYKKHIEIEFRCVHSALALLPEVSKQKTKKVLDGIGLLFSSSARSFNFFFS